MAEREAQHRQDRLRPVSERGAGEGVVSVGLNAAIMAADAEAPRVLTIRYPETVSNAAAGREDPDILGLPFGPFEPEHHRTLELGLRTWVAEQTQVTLGYAEQLYTFGDRGRQFEPGGGPRIISVGYLALTNQSSPPPTSGAAWANLYRFFPWEDWREHPPAVIEAAIRPALERWAERAGSADARNRRLERAAICFGLSSVAWDEEKVLERYELLYEAGQVYEATRDRGPTEDPPAAQLGQPMRFDHRRILATALGRLRGKLKYRPVIFEMMPATFTLFELQRTVEAISGVRLHKQNFRRYVEKSGLVEPTGTTTSRTGGRPAALYRFRREVVRESQAPGVRLSTPRP